MSAVVKFLVGAIFGALCLAVLSPALAAFHNGGSAFPSIAMGVVVLGVIALSLFAPTIRRALGRGFLALGVCFLFLPISATMLSGRAAHEVISNSASSDQGIAAVGAGAAAVAVTGAATFIGLIFGAILVIVGLVLALGGRREVIIVERR